MNDTPGEALARLESACRASRVRRRSQLAQAKTEAVCKHLREQFAGKPQTFKDGEIVKYIAPDGMMGPFRVGILNDGSVGLWFRQPGRKYAKDDWGDRVHGIVEKGETFPGTDIVMVWSVFATTGPDTVVNLSYLLKTN
jgi:hypothetical protein